MQSAQESKQELEAAIRYAENAISSAKRTIESMEFRQEMAKKQSSEKTGREQALERDLTVKTSQAEAWRKEYEEANKEVQRQQDLGQGYYDSMMEFKAQMALLKERIADMQSDMEAGAADINTLKEEREMLEKNVKYLRDENERLKLDKPTMPVIPKAVAIAIFREGMQHGVEAACTELEGQTIEVNENEYCGGFEVSFSKEIDLDFELDLDWMRGKVGNYSEEFVVDALSTLCSDKEFECRIHGVDDEEILRRDWKKKDD